MKCFVEVGAYPDKLGVELITEEDIINFVKNNNDKYILGGYRNGDSPIEVQVSVAIDVPKIVEDEIVKKIKGEEYSQEIINEFKKGIREEYGVYREKEIFFTGVSGENNLETTLEEFMSNIVPYEGFSIEFKNGIPVYYELGDYTLLEPTYDNSYKVVSIKELGKEEIDTLKSNGIDLEDLASNKYKLFLSDDKQSGFIMNGNKVENIFSEIEGRESEILVAVKKSIPQFKENFVDLTKIISEFKDIVLEQQQVLGIEDTQQFIMFGTDGEALEKVLEGNASYSKVKDNKGKDIPVTSMEFG